MRISSFSQAPCGMRSGTDDRRRRQWVTCLPTTAASVQQQAAAFTALPGPQASRAPDGCQWRSESASGSHLCGKPKVGGGEHSVKPSGQRRRAAAAAKANGSGSCSARCCRTHSHDASQVAAKRQQAQASNTRPSLWQNAPILHCARPWRLARNAVQVAGSRRLLEDVAAKTKARSPDR